MQTATKKSGCRFPLRQVSGLAALLLMASAFADQMKITSYDRARPIFWAKVYPDKPTGRAHSDLYWGFDFRNQDDVEMQIEHVYPANWIGTALGCGSREHCQRTNDRFNIIEADLHNLWPAEKNANQVRSNHSFAVIRGENWHFENCDMEKAKTTFEGTPTGWVIEPRRIARGNAARSIFYMALEYGLPIEPRLVPLLKAWNRSDKVSADERRRNDIVERLQGTRNPYIDEPAAVEQRW